MKLLLSIVLISVISLIGSRVTFLNRKLPLGIRTVLLTGVEYIAVGFLLGGTVLNFLDVDTLASLTPFLVFGLSWIGLLFGLQLEIKFLKKLPKYYFSITAIQAGFTFTIVSGVIFLISVGIFDQTVQFSLTIALALASAAACTAQSAIAIVSRNYKPQNRGLLGLLRYISSVDGLFAVVFFFIALGIVYGFQNSEFQILKFAAWIVSTIILGIIPAIIMIALSKVRFSQSEYFVFLIGTVTLAGGIAMQLNRSPLVIGMITGTVVANFCRHRVRAIDIVGHAERTIYIILLILIGAYWSPRAQYAIVLIVGYSLARMLGKSAGAFIALSIFKPKYPVPKTVGLSLLSEGGLAVAIALDFYILFPHAAQLLMTVIIFSILTNELIGPRLIILQLGPPETLNDVKPAGATD